MASRRLFLDHGPGETRAVVTLGDAPERLLIERAGEGWPLLGSRYVARVAHVDRGAGLAQLDIGEDGPAALRVKPDRSPPREGAALEVEISIEPQGDKAAVVRALGEASGTPRRLAEASDLEQRLQAWAPGAAVERGREARQVADEAQALALAAEFGLAGGGSLALEPTRALTAIDIDLGAGVGRDARRAARQANLQAIALAARLLRLKALGGLVVIDLVGRGHDGPALLRAVQAAFGPEQPGLAIGPVTRFGTLELAVPRRFRPIADILCAGNGHPSATTQALDLLRAVEREALADPGGRFLARARPTVAAAAEERAGQLADRIGRRFRLEPDPALEEGRYEVTRP
jgi:Ribonuclease G/E